MFCILLRMHLMIHVLALARVVGVVIVLVFRLLWFRVL